MFLGEGEPLLSDLAAADAQQEMTRFKEGGLHAYASRMNGKREATGLTFDVLDVMFG